MTVNPHTKLVIMVYQGEHVLVPVSFPTDLAYAISILRSNHGCEKQYYELASKRRLFRAWFNVIHVSASVRYTEGRECTLIGALMGLSTETATNVYSLGYTQRLRAGPSISPLINW